ncbi:MAG TPA: radical SAM protein [Desulfuromonadales bacterium]|nr:radical SAM protein [Desulfuromonadales bacterium]
MNIDTRNRTELIEANRREYGERYASLKFLSGPEAEAAQARRTELLAALAGRTESGYLQTKLDCRRLSPGCRLCGEGSWSCLFINGRCNGRCFYCPAPQTSTEQPTTNTLRFPQSADYVDYVEKFGFRGVSISGGEPLLTPEKTLKFITAVKKRRGDAVHLWLYTNGTLVTRDSLLRLRDAGLDEIRFDIGATRYHLKKAALAVGIIPHVTVEIPAIPEDLPLLKAKAAEMAERGIDYLNLHQLRLTPHNHAALAGRGYSFVHGEKVTVLESELAALELLRHTLDNNIELPVNYCSFVYKNRFQRLAARRRHAPFVSKPTEDLTENGYLRSLALTGSSEALRRQAATLAAREASREGWELSPAADRLAVSATLWPLIDFTGLRLLLRYAEASLQPAVTYRNPFVEVPLNKGRKVVIERQNAGGEMTLEGEEIAALGRLLGGAESEASGALRPEIARCERITAGLGDYF